MLAQNSQLPMNSLINLTCISLLHLVLLMDIYSSRTSYVGSLKTNDIQRYYHIFQQWLPFMLQLNPSSLNAVIPLNDRHSQMLRHCIMPHLVSTANTPIAAGTAISTQCKFRSKIRQSLNMLTFDLSGAADF